MAEAMHSTCAYTTMTPTPLAFLPLVFKLGFVFLKVSYNN